MSSDTLVIDRVHVQAHGRSAPGGGSSSTIGLRLGLEQTLRQLRPRPAHLPPQAILVIRRLASQAAFGLEPGQRQRWRQQLEDQIDELARQALRPGRQYVPPQANSVLFDDEVELLLCYTRDLLASRWAWYWQELFAAAAQPGQPAGQRLLTAWQDYPQAVPHTLVALRPPEAVAALGRLNRSELSRLARSLHDTFALPRGALDAASPEPGRPGDPANRTPAATPWQEWLPVGQNHRLTPPAVYVLGLSYTLVRRLQQARGPAFGEQARRWLEEAASTVCGPSWPSFDAARSSLSSDPARLTLSSDPARSPDFRADSADHQALAAPYLATPTLASNSRDRNLASQTLAARGSDAAAPDREPWTAATLGAGSFTRLGGAIYFINLLTRLGLPEAIPALADLNPWELLGGLVAGLLGGSLEHYAADSLWAMISELAALEPDRTWGATLPPVDEFRLPAAWLALLPPGRVIAYEGPTGHLQLWAGAPGYLLADLRAGTSLDEWPDLDHSPEAPAGLEDVHELAGQMLSPNLAWLVRRLRPFLGQLLAQLLGHPDAAAETLFRQPATLYVSRTHVDMLLSVEQASISVRRAGLDLSPGWRPEFGYIITIHFE